MNYYQCSACHELMEDLKQPCLLGLDAEPLTKPNYCILGRLSHAKWSPLTPKEVFELVQTILGSKALEPIMTGKDPK